MRRLADLVVRWPWAVIGVWIAIAVALPLTFPSLNEMAQRHPLAILPSRRPVERRRPADDRGVSRIGFGQPSRSCFYQRNRAQARRRSHLPQGGGRAARRRDRCRDGSGLHHHTAIAPVPDEQGQDDLGAAGRPCGRVGHAARLRGLQPSCRHRQTQRRRQSTECARHRTRGHCRRPHRRGRTRSPARSRLRSASWYCSFCCWCTATRSPCCCRWRRSGCRF